MKATNHVENWQRREIEIDIAISTRDARFLMRRLSGCFVRGARTTQMTTIG
jgi:hypothetical protein